MANGLLTANIGAGIAQGSTDALQYERDRPMREMRLEQARMQQERSRMELDEFKDNAEGRDAERDKALAEAQLGAYQANTANLQSRTYDAFRRYDTDGDVRHINTFLKDAKNNPVGKNMYGDYARVDSIDNVDRQEAERLMRTAGFPDPAAILDDAEASKDYLVATDNSGNRGVLQMSRLQTATGYTQHMTQQELETAKIRAQVAQLEKYPASAESQLIRDIAKENKITLAEAVKLYTKYQSKSSGSTLERVAATIRANNPGMSEEAALRDAAMLVKSGGTASEREGYERAVTPEPDEGGYLDEWGNVNNRKERTTTQKNADDAEQVRVSLDETPEGEPSYFEADMSDPAVRRKFAPKVHRLEQLTGNKLSTEDKRVARNIRDLLSLGSSAGEDLGPKETGLLDHMLKGFKKYVTDNVDGTAATSSYETFRNIFRNALYGSSLTDSEIKAFNTAAGSLGQQLGPVLQQLQVQMQSMRSQMQSIYDLNDEYISHYYLGTDLETLDRAIEGLDTRLEEFKSREESRPKSSGDLPRIKLKSSMSDEEAFSTMDQLAGDA